MKDQQFDTILLDLFINGDLATRIGGIDKLDSMRFIKTTLVKYCKTNQKKENFLGHVKEKDIDDYLGRLKIRWESKENINKA